MPFRKNVGRFRYQILDIIDTEVSLKKYRYLLGISAVSIPFDTSHVTAHFTCSKEVQKIEVEMQLLWPCFFFVQCFPTIESFLSAGDKVIGIDIISKKGQISVNIVLVSDQFKKTLIGPPLLNNTKTNMNLT